MARNDGVNRTTVRNANLTNSKIGNAQKHNEREKENYTNQDIIPERTPMNIHYKDPSAGYKEMFAQMEQERIISTRGLKDNANHFGELIFDVNSAYFHNNGDYEFAKDFYAEAYQSAIKIVGGEQYILSAVMHADERNRAMSEALGQDIYHYHLHVVYIPVVEKQVLWSKRCKDEQLRGTVKEKLMQVSSSKKWASAPATDEEGKILLTKNGKPVLRKSYSVLQDDFHQYMVNAGYTDVERGERGSSEEHLTVTQFKVMQEEQRLASMQIQQTDLSTSIHLLDEEKEKVQDELKRIAPRLKNVETLAEKYSTDPEKLLPEPLLLQSAGSYRKHVAMPLLKKIVKVLKDIYCRYLEAADKLERLNKKYDYEVGSLQRQVRNAINRDEDTISKAIAYEKLFKVLGVDQISALLESTTQRKQERKHDWSR